MAQSRSMPFCLSSSPGTTRVAGKSCGRRCARRSGRSDAASDRLRQASSRCWRRPALPPPMLKNGKTIAMSCLPSARSSGKVTPPSVESGAVAADGGAGAAPVPTGLQRPQIGAGASASRVPRRTSHAGPCLQARLHGPGGARSGFRHPPALAPDPVCASGLGTAAHPVLPARQAQADCIGLAVRVAAVGRRPRRSAAGQLRGKSPVPWHLPASRDPTAACAGARQCRRRLQRPLAGFQPHVPASPMRDRR